MTPRVVGRIAGLACFLMLALGNACRSQMAPASSQLTATGNAVLYIQGFTPPPEYARWYSAMERCTGLTGNYAKVRWYVTARPWSDGMHGDRLTYGMWRPSHRIVVNLPELLDSALVTHEILHDILGANGKQSDKVPHPLPWFGSGPLACSSEFHP